MINRTDIFTALIMLYTMTSILFLVIIIDDESFRFANTFNPIENYKRWKQFNWFGIIIITLALNIIFLPFAVLYWLYKLLTVGRKQ
jgi:hypothetical protein